ncbi:MAG TPA: sugar ABC transporter ATP-binding protein [Acidimicrobiia bacterium]
MLKVEGISKQFDGVHALTSVDAEFKAGEVHAVVGENGAGKSTLVKIMAGVHGADSGTLFLDGDEVTFASPRDAIDASISVVYQEPSLVPMLTVEDNLILGREPTRRGFISNGKAREFSIDALRMVGASIDPGSPVERLTIAERQLVEIAKALSLHSRMILLDEPTSSLSITEIERLRGVVEDLRSRDVAVVLVTHDLDEVFLLADRVTVLKDGKVSLTSMVADVTAAEVIKAMIGRDLAHMFPPRTARERASKPVVQVKGLTIPGRAEDISFELRESEVVGFVGLIGAGRTDVAKALVGATPSRRGDILIDGVDANVREPADAVALGLALVPEDRLADGLVMDLGVKQNIGLPQLNALSTWGVIDKSAEAALADGQIESLSIRTPSNSTVVHNLSGGNQQKVVLGRWLAKGCRVLILDEPTRGVDVGAKAEIYRIIRQLADEGTAVMLISSELPEILHLSDRIIVMSKGRIVAEIENTSTSERDLASEEDLVKLALGLQAEGSTRA